MLASPAAVARVFLILVGLSLATGVPLAALGQVSAPSLVEEDLPAAEEPRREPEPKPPPLAAEPEPHRPAVAAPAPTPPAPTPGRRSP